MLPQVRQLVRSITADEYDAAVETCPAACPLYMMGDRRTGQQLLHDAPADARTSLRDFFTALGRDPVREADFLRRLGEPPSFSEPLDPLFHDADGARAGAAQL